jgi:serine/threonine-protein kinase
VATNRDGEVRRDDPPLDLAGMAGVVLDPGGRLTTFIAVPPRVEESGPGPAPDWAALFLEAGLEPDRFRPVPPAWTAPVDSDSKAAWLGVHPSQPDLPLRVEAAAYHGRPVWFALLPPWAAAADDGPSVSPTPVGQVAVWILALAMPLGGAILARRNLRLGRGDAKGGLRVALFIFASYGLARLFRTNHVPSFADELWILVKVFAYPSFWAIQAWLLYLALEPYARRRWPHVLISWKRLLEGRYRDPLVGRDLLVGSLAGILLAIGFQAFAVVPVWFGKAGITPIPYVVGTALSSYSEVLFRLFVNQYSAVFFAMVFLFLLVVTRMLVRSTWLAVLACCLLLAGPLQGENVAIEWLAGACRAVMMIGVLTLGGLLPLAVALLVMFSVGEVPISLDPSAWYAAHALPALAFLGGLAVYGFRTSLAGRSPFGGTLDD